MRQFLTGLPKAELHLHLEGSLGPQTVVDLATRNGVDAFDTVGCFRYELLAARR